MSIVEVLVKMKHHLYTTTSKPDIKYRVLNYRFSIPSLFVKGKKIAMFFSFFQVNIYSK